MSQANEIQDARTLFESAEKTLSPRVKADKLSEGIELLEAYCEDNPDMDESERNLILKLKRAHTRRLLSQLLSLNEIDLDIWFDYIVLLNLKLKEEMAYAISEDQVLSRNYEKFRDIWSKELLEAIEKISNNQR